MDFQSTKQVIRSLRDEGYRVDERFFRYLLDQFQLSEPSKHEGRFVWIKENIAEFRNVLTLKGRGPTVGIPEVLTDCELSDAAGYCFPHAFYDELESLVAETNRMYQSKSDLGFNDYSVSIGHYAALLTKHEPLTHQLIIESHYGPSPCARLHYIIFRTMNMMSLWPNSPTPRSPKEQRYILAKRLAMIRALACDLRDVLEKYKPEEAIDE